MQSKCFCLTLLAVMAVVPHVAQACPFCAASGQTLSEELGTADIVLFAQLVYLPKTSEGEGADEGPDTGLVPAIDSQSGNAKFKIIGWVKGESHLSGLQEIEAIFFGDSKPGTVFMITGLGTDSPQWTAPLPVGAAAQEYIRGLPRLPEKGADRLVFFQDYFEHNDPMLSQDAYDEFARAPYSQLIGLRDRMRHDPLVTWIQDLTVPPSHRRLYLTMLGTCGVSDDVEMLESMIRSDDKKVKNALDAIIGCYLTLKGPDGLPLVDDLFLKNPDATYKETYDAVMALRFHGQETKIIPRERLLVSMRYLLDNPDLADQVITDLTRWQDWSVLDRLIELFKRGDDKSRWSRVPIAQYLMVCSREDTEVGRRAKTALDELGQLDPDVIKRAKAYFAFGGFAAARSDIAASSSEVDPQPATNGPKEDVAIDKSETTEAVSAVTQSTPSGGAAETQDATSVPDEAADESSEGAESDEVDAPGRLKLIVVSLGGALALLILLWLILRGAGQPSER